MADLTSGDTVSVAIPTLGRASSLSRTISGILAGTFLPNEIVVADQGDEALATDPFDELATAAARANVGLRRVRVPPRGVSTNRNHAVAATRGEFIAFCDDDITVDAEWLERMVEEWISRWSRGPVIITGPILPAGEGIVRGVRASSTRRVHHAPPARGDTLYGGHFGAPRTVYEILGPRPFDERLGPGAPYHGAEDEDFGRRALAAGIPVVYEPAIVVRHHALMGDRHPSTFRSCVGAGAMLAKAALDGQDNALRNLVWSLAVAAGKAGRAAVRRDTREAVERLRSVAGIATGFARWIARGESSRTKGAS